MKAKRNFLSLTLVLGCAVLMVTAAFLIFNAQAQAKSSERGFLGVYLGSGMDEEFRESLGFKGSGGAFIDQVVEDGPADKAGLEDGDIIVKFNGKEVESESYLRRLIRKTTPGDKVKVTVFRDGKEMEFGVEMGKSKELKTFSWDKKQWFPKISKHAKKIRIYCDEDRAWLGVELQDLSEQLGEYFKVKDGEGALVSSVVEKSPAEKAGLKAGDVIVKLDGEDVDDSDDVIEVICDKKPDDEVTVEVVRGGKTKTIKAVLTEHPEKCKCYIYGPGMLRHHDLKSLKGLGALEGLEALKDIEIEIPEVELEEMLEELKDIDIEIEQPVEDLKQQIEELREEIEKLKEKMK